MDKIWYRGSIIFGQNYNWTCILGYRSCILTLILINHNWFLSRTNIFWRIKYDFEFWKKKSKTKILFFKGHLTFLRGKIIHILEQDSYRNEGLSVYEISRNGTTTKLNNKVQGLNQKESRLRGRCIARKLPILEHFLFLFYTPSQGFLKGG